MIASTGDVYFFRKLFDLMPQLGWTALPDGFIDWYNRGWYEYTGYTIDDMRGWGWESVHDPEVLPLVKERWLNSIRSQQPFEMRFPLRSKDGDFNWFINRINPILDEQGKLIRWVGIHTNIQNEIEQATRLAEVKAQLEAITNNATVALFFMDEHGLCTFANPAALEMTGYEFAELEGQTLHDKVHWLHPNGQPYPMSDCPIDRALPEKNQIRNMRDVFLRKDGRFFAVEVSASPVENMQKVRAGTIIEVVDISERVRLEQKVSDFTHSLESKIEERTSELAKAQTLTDLILESISDAIIVADQDGHITFLNKAARQLHGDHQKHAETFEEIPRVFDLFELDGESYFAADKLPLARALTGENVDDQEMVIKSHDRSRAIFASVSARPFFSFDGTLLGAVVAVRDITARKEVEQAVAKARDEAISANEAKSRFLATVSHEVRTPMAGIIGLVELIKLSASDEVLADMASTALDSCKRLLQILNDLLDSSKLQAGAVTLERRFFAVRPIIGDLVQLVTRDAQAKNIRIESCVSSIVPDAVCGDELRLRQILQNLLFNAIKFTNEGHVAISVEVAEKRDATTILKFSVSDTGIGITAEQQEKIFQPFVQAEDSTARLFGGTGLGLSICQTLVQLMDGEIIVASEPGRGSTFSVLIPFGEELCMTE